MKTRRYIIFATIALVLNTLALQAQESPKPDIFAKIETGRPNVFQNETIVLELFIYSRKVLSKDMQLRRMPDASIFKIVKPFESLPVTNDATHQIRKFRCTIRVMKPGRITLNPELFGTVVTRKKDGFFFSSGTRSLQKIPITPLTITVRPLPRSNRPKDFSGLIGSASFEAAISTTNAVIGDLITLKMNIKATGNIKDISSPRISSSPNFKVYDPKQIPAENDSERIFEQVIIPQNTNALEAPSISFSFFDPSKGIYKTIEEGPFPISLHPPKKITQGEHYRPTTVISNKEFAHGTEPEEKPTLKQDWLAKKKTITIKKSSAKLAPSVSAFTSFELPKGSIVEIIESYDKWAKVHSGNKRGWIPVSAINPQSEEQ